MPTFGSYYEKGPVKILLNSDCSLDMQSLILIRNVCTTVKF